MADPFDLLGIPATFDLDERALHRAWLLRSSALHADRSTDESAAESLRAAAEVNRARAELADPVRRAEALLARLDPGAAPDKSLPDGFLMELLEAREGLESAAAANDRVGIAHWHAWATRLSAEYNETTKRLFAQHPTTPATLAEIRRTLNARRSITRMLEQMPEA